VDELVVEVGLVGGGYGCGFRWVEEVVDVVEACTSIGKFNHTRRWRSRSRNSGEEEGRVPVEILLICLSDIANLTSFFISSKINLVVGNIASTGKGSERHFVSTPSNTIPPENVVVFSVGESNSANFSAFTRC
jgi:hypothetical protein